MPPVTCRRCKGSRGSRNRKGQWFDCSACNGSGINHDLWETHCRECYTSIVYKKGQNEPQYCKSCRNREKTKTCAQYGCTNTIRYKLGWTNVSEYCGPCRKHRERGDTAKSCTSCGTLIWVPWGKNFTMCRDCNERERAKKAAQWKTKSCSKCGAEVKYHVDWNQVPDLCKSCKEKEKAKWKTKPCAGGCGNTIKYHEDWDHPPNFCNDCKKKGTERRHESNQSENPRFNAACGKRGANLNPQEKDGFRAYFHTLHDRQRMSFDEIVSLAQEWKNNNGGGFRRSDRSRR